jgi:hypothetical protein
MIICVLGVGFVYLQYFRFEARSRTEGLDWNPSRTYIRRVLRLTSIVTSVLLPVALCVTIVTCVEPHLWAQLTMVCPISFFLQPNPDFASVSNRSFKLEARYRVHVLPQDSRWKPVLAISMVGLNTEIVFAHRINLGVICSVDLESPDLINLT